jgi:MoaA/NifB/PqqE/SkfB family radical SAM enzyme
MSPDDPRLASVRDGRLDHGPETLQLNLTNRCNLRCIFCWNHSPLVPQLPPAWHAQRMSDAHLDGVIRALPALRPGRVLLSGRGEPLLHPGVMDLLRALHERRVPVSIQTNGVGGPTPESLAELGVAHLLVNLSAGSAESYCRTHPGAAPELFGKVLERLHRLRRLGTRITLVAVVQRSNADQLLPLLERCEEIGADHLHLKGLELSGAPALRELALDGAQREQVQRDLEQVRRSGVSVDASHLLQVLDARAGDRAFTPHLAGGPCYMGWYYLRVTCDGRVMFCCKDKLVDHLDRRDLYSIWRSPAYHLWRLAGRDSDTGVGLFDEKCRACSNFAQNAAVAARLSVRAGLS